MPAAAEGYGSVAPRERLRALVAVAIVQAALGYVLLSGLNVGMLRKNEFVSRQIDITLPPPPPPPHIVQPPPKPKKAPEHHASTKAAAPPPKAANPGGSPGPAPPGNAVIARVPIRDFCQMFQGCIVRGNFHESESSLGVGNRAAQEF